MRLGKNLEGNGLLAKYSDSLIRGVVLNAKLASAAPHSLDVVNFNTSCVLFAVAFLEAQLNEIISNINEHGSHIKEIPQRHWELLKEQENKLDVSQKWDYIASAYGGSMWDSGKRPFQSYDLLKSLRNELIHYKGGTIETGIVPKKKLQNFLSQFKGMDYDYKLEAFFGEEKHWVYQILSSREFGRLIALETLVFDVNQRELLLGQTKSEKEKLFYWSKWDQVLGFSQQASNCNFNSMESVLQVIESVVLPEVDTSDNVSQDKRSLLTRYKDLVEKIVSFFMKKNL